MTFVRRNLRLKMINSSELNSYVVRSLVDAFSNIRKKYRSKDRNVVRHVLSQSFVNKSTRALLLLKPTSKLVGLDIKHSIGIVLEENNLTLMKQMSGPSLAGCHAPI